MSIFFNGVVNRVFCVSLGTLRWQIFSKKLFKFSIHLRTLTGKNSLIRQAFFSRFEEIPFYVSIDIFWGKLFGKKLFSLSFLDNEHNFFCCQNCVLRVPRNILTKFFFEENVYFFIFPWHWANHFRLFVGKIEAGMPELHSTCLQEQFERFVLLKKSWISSFFFGHLAEKLWLYVNIFQWGCQ